jgi:NADH-quinone oxidoreductase subunit J
VETQRRASRQWKTGVALAAVLAVELGFFLVEGADWLSLSGSGSSQEAVEGNTEAVGTLLYTTYLLPFEIASVLLLVAIVGAVVLAKKDL